MSDYDNTRYYWLQLREEFFESDEIGPQGGSDAHPV